MINEMNDIDNNLNNIEFARIRSQFKIIFRRSSSLRNFQQCEKTTNSNRFNKICNNQNIIDIKFDIDIVYFQNSHSKKKPKIYKYLNLIIIEFIILFFDHSIFLNAVLSRDSDEQIIRGNDYKTTIIIYFFHVIIAILSLFEQFQVQKDSILNKKKWKIVKIVDKKRKRKNYKYKIYWKKI